MSELNALANSLAAQRSVRQLQVANYFTPYGFDPELADFRRAGELLAGKADITGEVFGQASPNLQQRVSEAAAAYHQNQAQLDALTAAGAEVTDDDEAQYQAALGNLFQRQPAAA